MTIGHFSRLDYSPKMTVGQYFSVILCEIDYNGDMLGIVKTQKIDKIDKSNKAERLLEAAFDLFVEHGDIDVSVSEIAARANIAKGTFYLYFHDKDDLREQLITQKSHELLRAALDSSDKIESATFEDRLVYVINFIIDYLTQNPVILKLIAKNLSFGMFNERVQQYIDDDKSDIMRALIMSAKRTGIRLRSPQILLFMIIELTSSTCFSCILESKPLPIEEYKPFLFETVRRIIRDFTITAADLSVL